MRWWNRGGLLLLLLASPLLDGLAKGAGSYAAPFLTIGFGSRAQSLGNAFTALADDASSAFFNPAGLTQRIPPSQPSPAKGGREIGSLSPSYEIQASRSSWFQGITIDQIAIMRAEPGPVAWGVSMTGLEVDGLERRSSETAQPEGYFRAEDRMIGLSIARRLSGPLCIGATGKVVQQRIAATQGNTVAFDAGSQYRFRFLGQSFGTGLSLRNIGPSLRFGREAYSLPTTYHVGFAYQGLINQALEISFTDSGLSNVSMGTEYWFLGVFGIRGGYLQGPRRSSDQPGNIIAGVTLHSGFTGGFGFKVMNLLNVDYAFVPFGEIGSAQRFTLSYKF